MIKLFTLFISSVCILVCLATTNVFAQTSINTDSLLREAQQSAAQKNYELARKQADMVISLAPDYTDAYILIGQTFAWEGNYDAARAKLIPLLETDNSKATVLQVLSSVELWAGQYAKSIFYADQALAVSPASETLYLTKISALRELKSFSAALDVAKIGLKYNPDAPQLNKVFIQLKQLSFKHELSVDYQYTIFDQDIPNWSLGTVQYTNKSKNVDINAKVNVAARFDIRGLQGEIDLWPRFNDKTYAYLNVGFSESVLFPQLRTGAEIYRAFPKHTEASIGFRKLMYTHSTVWLYTGHIGKYIQKYWVGFRPFFQYNNNEWNTTGILQLKRYFRESDEFVGISLSKGSTPLMQVALTEINRLDANKIAFDGQVRVGLRALVGGTLQYEHESYEQNQKRNRFTSGLTLKIKF